MTRKPRKPNINVGDVFNRLTVVSQCPYVYNKEYHWNCQCVCGEMANGVRGSSLKNGHTQSCGCLALEVRSLAGLSKRTHGASIGQSKTGKVTSEYATWRQMKARCHRESDPSYEWWGGRGIQVCDRWLHSFENFIADMGPKPSPELTIERRDNEQGYTPENCYWGTRLEQGRNKRNNVRVTIGDETLCISEWAERSGIQASTLQRRYHAGWPTEKFLLPSRFGQKIMYQYKKKQTNKKKEKANVSSLQYGR